jgi:hypothetical protein
MKEADTVELRKAIESQHGGTATLAQSVPVRETFEDQPGITKPVPRVGERVERIESRRAAADLEKFQTRREMDCPTR